MSTLLKSAATRASALAAKNCMQKISGRRPAGGIPTVGRAAAIALGAGQNSSFSGRRPRHGHTALRPHRVDPKTAASKITSTHDRVSAGSRYFATVEAVVGLLLFALLSPGCDQSQPDTNLVTIPAADPTPPIATLDVSGFGLLIEVTSTSGSVNRTGGASDIGLIGVATDNDGGARQVTLVGEYTRNCLDATSNLGQSQHGTFAPVGRTQPGKPGDQVTKKLVVQFSFRVADYLGGCPVGFKFTSLDMDWHVVAVNFFSSTDTTADFSFHYPK